MPIHHTLFHGMLVSGVLRFWNNMEQINEKVGLHASSTVAVVVISPYYNDLLRHNVYLKAAFPYVL